MNDLTTQRPAAENPGLEAPGAARIGRLVPLAGAGFAALTMAGFLTMGKYADSDVSTTAVTAFYSAHHARILEGGIVLAYAAILFAFFGAAIWSRIRRTDLHPFVGCAALVGAAVTTAGLLASASTYFVLGDIGHKHTISAPALQALHIFASELYLPVSGGVEILLLSVALAGILARAFPRWLSWSALLIGVLQLTTIGTLSFTAFLAFLLWSFVAGIVLVLRPASAEPATDGRGATAPVAAPAR